MGGSQGSICLWCSECRCASWTRCHKVAWEPESVSKWRASYWRDQGNPSCYMSLGVSSGENHYCLCLQGWGHGRLPTGVCVCGVCSGVCSLGVSYAQVAATGEIGIWGQTECLLEGSTLYTCIFIYISHYWTSSLLSLGGEQDEAIGAACVNALCRSVWQPCIYVVYMCVCVHVPVGNTCSALPLFAPGSKELWQPCLCQDARSSPNSVTLFVWLILACIYFSFS